MCKNNRATRCLPKVWHREGLIWTKNQLKCDVICIPQDAFQPTTFDTMLKGVKQFALQAKWDLMAAHDAIIVNCVQQMFHANKKCCASDLYHVGDHVYLSTQNLTLPKGRARKLVPKYIEPYKVVKAYNEASTVTLELPPALVA